MIDEMKIKFGLRKRGLDPLSMKLWLPDRAYLTTKLNLHNRLYPVMYMDSLLL